MSAANHDLGRGKNVGRGRPGRGRGRGRGNFRFPGPKSVVNGRDDGKVDNFTANIRTNPRGSDTRSLQMEKMAENPEMAAEDSLPMNANDDPPSSKLSKRELPPHIAGAAVDGESLVSRVRELAISSHAHTSSVESRFTMSLNWADEEDDPDSLPSLDDWAVGPKVATPVPNASNKDSSNFASNLKGVSAPSQDHLDSSMSTTEKPFVDKERPTEDVELNASVSPRRPLRSGGGTAASIWASKSPSPPPSNAQRGRGGRQHNVRESRDHIHRARDTPPLRADTPPQTSTTPPEDERRPLRPGTGAKKPHARPIISTDAIARISRTLGAETIRKEQPTAT